MIKTAYRRLQRWAKQKKKVCTLSEAEYTNLRKQTCFKCNCEVEGTGINLLLRNKKLGVSLENVDMCCKACQLAKPKQDFNPITHAKQILRRYWKRTPMATIAEHRARKHGKYQCAECTNLFIKKKTHLDHILPVVDVNKNEELDLNVYVKNLYCDDSNLQLLCIECHKRKTKMENRLRKKK